MEYMKYTTLRSFAAGFAATLIAIGALCGFLLVDLSTERYMPGRFGSMLIIFSITQEGMDFSVMGREYHFSFDHVQEKLLHSHRWQGLLPAEMQLGSLLGAEVCSRAQDALEQRRQEQAQQAMWDDEA